MKFFVKAPDGTRTQAVEARKFSYYVDNILFWFAVHDDLDHKAALAVSHFASGARVCVIGPTERLAGVGMDKPALARAALKQLIARRGEARVRSVLAAAEQGD